MVEGGEIYTTINNPEQVSIGAISIGKLPKPLGSIRELSYLDSKPVCHGHSIRELDLAGLS